MTKIQIRGSVECYEAAEWCEHTLKWEDWEMWMDNSWSTYTFEFINDQDATLFALRWGPYALT